MNKFNQSDLIDMYKILQPKAAIYIFFFGIQETFNKRNQMLEYKTNHNTLKTITTKNYIPLL